MVGHTDLLIAVWDGGPGGTANTIHYARSNGFPSGSSMYRCEGWGKGRGWKEAKCVNTAVKSTESRRRGE